MSLFWSSEISIIKTVHSIGSKALIICFAKDMSIDITRVKDIKNQV